MLEFDVSRADPATVAAEDLTFRAPLDLSFGGWQPEAFNILERLREHPHIEQYRREKDDGGLARFIKEPFKRYRDDLVVNWVLPSRLAFETEKNIFSRLLKNDFGAGGCHHHKWMAFYRPGLKRLKDVQLSHSLSPSGMTVGIYVGAYARDLLAQAQARIEAAPQRYLALINPLLEQPGWRFSYHYGTGTGKARPKCEAPLAALPGDLPKANGIALRRLFPRPDVEAAGPAFVGHALDAMQAVWPLYRFYLAPPSK